MLVSLIAALLVVHGLVIDGDGGAHSAAASFISREQKRCPNLPALTPNATKLFALSTGKFNATTQFLAYNNSAVGPLIKVNLGDVVQVDITNRVIVPGTSVHWHGQELKNAFWADGTDFISQYAIRAGDTFSYRFTAGPAGTFWYHSHTEVQFGDGLRGPLVVVDPNDLHKSLYDNDLDEHILMLADVFDSTVEDQLMMLRKNAMRPGSACKYWVNIGTLSGQNSPAILHYEGASNPLEDAAFLTSANRELGCNYGVPGQAGMVDPRNTTTLFSLSTSPAPPPQAANKQFTLYLANAASSLAPATLVQQINNKSTSVYGNITLPTSTVASCPDPTSKYCWSLNWNVFTGSDVPNIFYNENKPTSRTFNIDLTVGEVVDLVLINPTMMVHPMHLHGMHFWVLATGTGDPIDANGVFLPSSAAGYNTVNPPKKDTLPVTQAKMGGGMGNMGGNAGGLSVQNGYAVIRFRADNPGVWPFHCHIDLHMMSGMFLTFTVKQPGSVPWYVPDNLACASSNDNPSTPTTTIPMATATSAASSVIATTTKPSGGTKIVSKSWTALMPVLALLLLAVIL